MLMEVVMITSDTFKSIILLHSQNWLRYLHLIAFCWTCVCGYGPHLLGFFQQFHCHVTSTRSHLQDHICWPQGSLKKKKKKPQPQPWITNTGNHGCLCAISVCRTVVCRKQKKCIEFSVPDHTATALPSQWSRWRSAGSSGCAGRCPCWTWSLWQTGLGHWVGQFIVKLQRHIFVLYIFFSRLSFSRINKLTDNTHSTAHHSFVKLVITSEDVCLWCV